LLLDRPGEAETEAREALRLAPGFPPAVVYLAEALYRQSRYAEAADAYGDLVRLNPEDVDARWSYAVALSRSGQMDRARAAAQAARRAFPQLARFDFCLALVEAGADAIIAADLAVLAYARDTHPRARLHLSVQAAAGTADAIAFYAEAYQVKRVVLPRVLSAPEIAGLIRETSVEVEAFVFGERRRTVFEWVDATRFERARYTPPAVLFHTLVRPATSDLPSSPYQLWAAEIHQIEADELLFETVDTERPGTPVARAWLRRAPKPAAGWDFAFELARDVDSP
jgi:tetratricopeptide (TPR) repeat protein